MSGETLFEIWEVRNVLVWFQRLWGSNRDLRLREDSGRFDKNLGVWKAGKS